MNLNLNNNDDIVILTAGGVDYIRAISNATSPMQIFPGGNPITPGKEKWRMTANETITIDPTRFIRDNGNYDFLAIIGPRPVNIVRR